MDLTAKIGLLVSYYPFQVRVSSMLLDNHIFNNSSVLMMGIVGICTETCLQSPVKDRLNEMTNFDPVSAYLAITDQDLLISVLAAWDKLRPLLDTPSDGNVVVVE